MRKNLLVICSVISPIVAFASNEGVPVYYQDLPSYNVGYTGTGRPQNVLVGQTVRYAPAMNQNNSYNSYNQNNNSFASNGWNREDTDWNLSASIGRRYADFKFETGVLSKLSWTDMEFNELAINASKVYEIGGYDTIFKADYRHGFFADGGDSYDDDLRTNPLDPYASLYTISVGKSDGKTDSFKFSLGLKNIWDYDGWKFTPYIGYEVFQHKLKMKDHRYPNQGVNIPAMTPDGMYIFAGENTSGGYSYISSTAPDDTHPYQVCLTPDDLPSFVVNGDGSIGAGGSWSTYTVDGVEYTVWGVPANECVVIGGDGELLVDGVTHIYDTTWSGFFVGLGLEKQFSIRDKLTAYAQFGVPHYESDGIWPNRTDWQQDPSFTDEGSGGFSYKFEAEYSYAISPSLKLIIGVDTDFYRKGHTEGTLNLAGYYDYVYNADGTLATVEIGGDTYYQLDWYGEESVKDKDALNWAEWRSFGVHIGFKTLF